MIAVKHHLGLSSWNESCSFYRVVEYERKHRGWRLRRAPCSRRSPSAGTPCARASQRRRGEEWLLRAPSGWASSVRKGLPNCSKEMGFQYFRLQYIKVTPAVHGVTQPPLAGSSSTASLCRTPRRAGCAAVSGNVIFTQKCLSSEEQLYWRWTCSLQFQSYLKGHSRGVWTLRVE